MPENNLALRVIAGAAAVAAGAFVGLRLALGHGAEVGPVAWTVVAWTCLGVFLAALVVAALATIRFVRDEIRALWTLVDFAPEDGPGIAQVCVSNRGRSDTMVATARVVAIHEEPANRKFPRTYSLVWMGEGKPRTTIFRGSAETLLLATSERVEQTRGETHLYQVNLWGGRGEEETRTDWFRWNFGEEDAIRLVLTVRVTAQRSRQSASGNFEIRSLARGGIEIRRAPTPPTDLPQAEAE